MVFGLAQKLTLKLKNINPHANNFQTMNINKEERIVCFSNQEKYH
jgi:hypothetical protein